MKMLEEYEYFWHGNVFLRKIVKSLKNNSGFKCFILTIEIILSMSQLVLASLHETAASHLISPRPQWNWCHGQAVIKCRQAVCTFDGDRLGWWLKQNWILSAMEIGWSGGIQKTQTNKTSWQFCLIAPRTSRRKPCGFWSKDSNAFQMMKAAIMYAKGHASSKTESANCFLFHLIDLSV